MSKEEENKVFTLEDHKIASMGNNSKKNYKI